MPNAFWFPSDPFVDIENLNDAALDAFDIAGYGIGITHRVIWCKTFTMQNIDDWGFYVPTSIDSLIHLKSTYFQAAVSIFVDPDPANWTDVERETLIIHQLNQLSTIFHFTKSLNLPLILLCLRNHHNATTRQSLIGDFWLSRHVTMLNTHIEKLSRLKSAFVELLERYNRD